MKYRVTHEGRSVEVDVTVLPDGGVAVTQEGRTLDLEVSRVADGLVLRQGGRVYDLAVGGPAGQRQVAAGAARAIVEVESERERAKGARRKSKNGGAKEVRAPMPGRVVKVLVEVGQELAAGDPCVVVEAMKMENELRAEVAGTVETIHVREGANVETQTVLVSLK